MHSDIEKLLKNMAGRKRSWAIYQQAHAILKESRGFTINFIERDIVRELGWKYTPQEQCMYVLQIVSKVSGPIYSEVGARHSGFRDLKSLKVAQALRSLEQGERSLLESMVDPEEETRLAAKAYKEYINGVS